jgi:hypothetical protein
MFVTLVTTLMTLASPPPQASIPALARAALDGDASAVTRLRALGQPGLDALVELRRSLSSVPPLYVGEPTPAVKAWEALVDSVARQRFASASGLYWHTDLEAATARARRENKPILSLRLLGDLDEDLSCANSRFFRTILYPDPVISEALHDGWVLHWESVRKAPRIEIDFGDGKKLTRTITGNSLHYAMTADGEVTDVMPGMIGPQAFAAWLTGAAERTAAIDALPTTERGEAIRRRLNGELTASLDAWSAALGAIGIAEVPRALEDLAAKTDDAAVASLASERRVRISDEAAMLVEPMMLAGREVDRPSTRLAPAAMRVAVLKAVVEAPMLRLLTPVEGTLARDEVKNVFEMRSQLLTILASDATYQKHTGVPALTAAIYARAFLSPLDDPWMGLAPADVFTALPASVEKSTASK